MLTPTKTTSLTTAISSPRHTSTKTDEDLPQLFNFYKYNTLYNCIYETQKQAHKSIQNQEENKNITSSIAKKIFLKNRKISFQHKFSLTDKKKKRQIKEQYSMGKTKIAQNQHKLDLFFKDHRKAFNLLEQARLIQYFLTDQEKTKSKVDYLKIRQVTSQHRRLSLPNKEKQKMFLGKDQKSYNDARKKCYIKNDELMDKSFIAAKKNPSFMRSQNYALIQYVLKEDVRNLMQYSQIAQVPIEEQIKHNNLRKIYLHFAQSSESHRIYYDHITLQTVPRLIETIEKIAENYKITREKLQQIINYTLKYKYKKVLYFQDLRQLFEAILQKYETHMIQKFLQKMPQIFQNSIQTYSKQNAKMIETFLKKSKADIGIKLLFQSQEQKIIGKKYLPLYAIKEIMKKAKIIPKTITMCKFYHTCLWQAKRQVGYKLQEFQSIQLNLALSLQCNKHGIENYMQMLDLSSFAATN